MRQAAFERAAPERPFLHEWFFPYRGSWHLPWVIERYLRATRPAFTATKLGNCLRAIAEMQLGMTHVRSHPVVLRLEVCNVCNLRCPLCACGNGADKRSKGFISMDDFVFAIEQIEQSAMILRLDGLGEPTLHPQVFDFVRIGKERGLSVVMHSNLNTARCSDPKPFVESGLDRLVVSVDGLTPEAHSRYRVGGDLELVLSRIRDLTQYKKCVGARTPLIEVQMIDFEYNRAQRPELRRLCRELGVDRFQITEAEHSAKTAKYRPDRPRRCFWLWTVASVAWDLKYRSCANAWSLPWPGFGMRDVGIREWWNHSRLVEAREFNLSKSASSIANDPSCKCNRCYEMVVVPLEGAYCCE